MRRILPLVVLLLCAGTVHAQDNEVEQLKAQVQVLQQLVLQLTDRVNKLEGALAIQQANQSQQSASTPPSTTGTRRQFSSMRPRTSSQPTQTQVVEYTLEKVLPKLRIDGNHAFEIRGVETKPKPGSSTEHYVYFKILCTNRANDEWDTGQDSYRFLLDTGDLVGHRNYAFLYSSDRKIKKNERTERTIGFTVKDPKPELEGVLNITSKKYGTSVDFKVILKRNDTNIKNGN